MPRRMSKKEMAIREKRVSQATRNNLMGPTGKFGVILKVFGVPVLRQGSGLTASSYLDDPYEDTSTYVYESTLSGEPGPLVYKDEIGELNDDMTYQEGIIFDGLDRGMHLEIVYWEGLNSLKVSYKGHTVYEEVAGELEAYAPFPDWETIIDRLYARAKDRLRVIRQKEEDFGRRLAEQRQQSLWQKLKVRWGL